MGSAQQQRQIREIRRAGYLLGETAGSHCSACEKSCGKGWWRQISYEYDEWECYCRSCAHQAVRGITGPPADIDTTAEGGA